MEARPFRMSAQLILGLIVIFFGLIMTLDNFDVIESREYLKYWPVFVVIFGLSKTFQPRSGSDRNSGILIAVVGIILLLSSVDVFHIRFRNYWPLLLVAFGGSLIWRTTARYRLSADKQQSGDGDSFMNLFAFMGGFERTNNSQNFVGGEMTAIMGGCEVDLRAASIKEGEAVIDVFAFWGGVSLKVPEDWSVIVQGLPIMGGIEDKTKPPKDTSKRLIVKGYAIMGGVEIGN